MKYLLLKGLNLIWLFRSPPMEFRTYVGRFVRDGETRGFVRVALNPDQAVSKYPRVLSCHDVGPAPYRWTSLGHEYRLAYLNSIKEKHGVKCEPID